MVIEGSEYRPRYLVRMLGRLYNEIILQNIFSIRTGVFVDNVNGFFEIVVDNSIPITDPYSLFNIIQPMDYIEIFLSRDLDAFIPPSTTDIAATVSANAPPQPYAASGSGSASAPLTASPLTVTSSTGQTIINNLYQAITQWGYIDVNGNFNPATFTPISSSQPYKPPLVYDPKTDQIISTGSLNAFYTSLPNLNVQFTPIQTKIARPLSPAEKVNTPTFVFCGYVDTVSNEFAMGADGKVFPTIRITGRSVGKILTEHNIFTSSVLFTPLTQLQNALYAGMHPSIAIQNVINFFLQQILNLLYDPITNTTANSAAITSLVSNPTIQDMSIVLPLNSGTGASNQYSLNFPVFSRSLTTGVIDYTVANTPNTNPYDNNRVAALPSSSISYFPYSGDTTPLVSYLGRLMAPTTGVNNTQRVFNISSFSDGPLINTLDQMCNDFLNELWVDEAGRIVLRRVEEAWFQNIFKTQPVQGNTSAVDVSTNLENLQQYPVYTLDNQGNPIPTMIDSDSKLPSRYVVYAQDIIEWQLEKSDDNMVTLVMIQDMFSFLAMTNLSLLAGQAPLTTGGRLNAIQSSIDDLIINIQNQISTVTPAIATQLETQIAAALGATSTQGQLKALNQVKTTLLAYVSGSPSLTQAVNTIFSQSEGYITGSTSVLAQPQSLWTYNLTQDQDVINFWQNFLLRPKILPSIFATDINVALTQAEVYFQQLSAMLVRGTIVVKGNPRYKAGSRLYFQRLNADFYISGVEHNFPWGDGPYTTLLHVERGIFHGRPTGFYPPQAFQTAASNPPGNTT